MTIPVSFQFKGNRFAGELSSVHGGGVHVYHLMIDNYYYGRLRYVHGEWVFDSNKGSEGWESLADLLGELVLKANK